MQPHRDNVRELLGAQGMKLASVTICTSKTVDLARHKRNDCFAPNAGNEGAASKQKVDPIIECT
jgi:hypothetical protein